MTSRSLPPDRRYVVAFNRDRDFYQVPLALAEEGRLASLVTDFYLPGAGPLLSLPGLRGVRHRRVKGLPFSKVRWNASALWIQLAQLSRERAPQRRLALFKELDQALSRAALREALRHDADLFLYSGYAHEAFVAPEARDRHKGLFVYHPHGGLCLEILAADDEQHPEAHESFLTHKAEIEKADSSRLDAELAHAHFAVCASRFTARTLEATAFCPSSLTVAPYGSFAPPGQTPVARGASPVRFLFVGQGVQRKGLHHLLKVWKRLGVSPAQATLTLICSSLDAGIRALVPDRGVTVLGSQSKAALDAQFAAADVFVMPSLVEGFGLVYLEALAAGCFTIGTENTGLPDLAPPAHAADILRAGDLDVLSLSLDQARRRVESGQHDRGAVQAFARTLRWEAFRTALRRALPERRANLASLSSTP